MDLATTLKNFFYGDQVSFVTFDPGPMYLGY